MRRTRFETRFKGCPQNSLSVLVGLCLMIAPSSVLGQSQQVEDLPGKRIRTAQAAPTASQSANGKIQDQLLGATKRPNIAMQREDRGKEIEVDIVADVTDELLHLIRQLRGTVINDFPAEHAIRARIPIGALSALATNQAVKFISPAAYSDRNQAPPAGQGTPGTIEGDVAHRADLARSTYSVKGAGVTVCVISDSIDDGRGTLNAAITDGDVTAPPHLSVLAGQGGGVGTGEGLAMLEIVHKIAPNADLVFGTGYSGGPIQMAQNIRDFASVYKCKIIVDDVIYDNESPFQDGPIGRAINDVVAAGVLYISSAGNAGNSKHGTSGTWEGDFLDIGPDARFGSGRMHLFHTLAPGTPGVGYFLSSNSARFLTVTRRAPKVALFWSDPWFGSTNKYTLYIVANRGGRPVLVQSGNNYFPMQIAYPIDAQGQPAAIIKNGNAYDAQGNQLFFEPGDEIYVQKDDASQPRYLHIATFRGEIDHGLGSSIRGHNASPNVLSVGAVPVPSTGGSFANASNLQVEAQSSDGQRVVFFNSDDTSISRVDDPIRPNFNFLFGAGRTLAKPDLVAASNVKTTLPSTTQSGAPTGLNPFGGTSAAAPHVAGIAALMLSLRPELTPAHIKLILIASTMDIEATGENPLNSGFRWRSVSGFGIPMADKALALAAASINPRAGLTAAELRALQNQAFPGTVKSVSVDDQIYAGLVEDPLHGGIDRVLVKARSPDGSGAYRYVPGPRESGFGVPVDVVVEGTSAWVLDRAGTVTHWALPPGDWPRERGGDMANLKYWWSQMFPSGCAPDCN
jgi:subtilisin family serine protease